MAGRNGAGQMSVSFPDFVAGTTIVSGQVDANFQDVVTELTNSIAADGQTTPTANLPMGTFKHTGVGNASARNHYLAAGQAQDGSVSYGTVGGTADAITLTLSPAITAYAAGQMFWFKAASANTGAVTLAVSGLAAKAVQINGAALIAGCIKANDLCVVIYDGTQFQLVSASGGLRLPTVQVFTASGTYTKPAGLRAARIIVTAAGGGGGQVSGDSNTRAGGAGGAGGTAIKLVSAALLGATETVTIGAAGTAGGATGGTGGTSSLTVTGGSTVQATGGVGGGQGSAATPNGAGGTGGVGSNGDTNLTGGGGAPGADSVNPVGGTGGASFWGGGAFGSGLGAGTDGLAYGSGGSGASRPSPSATGAAGGAGAPGYILVEEFY